MSAGRAAARNEEIASALRELADLLELKGDNPFKIRAYRRAADVIEGLPEDAADLAAEGRLKNIEGIGEAIEKKAAELAATGGLRLLEGLRAEIPPGVREMLRVPGVGPRTAALVFRRLGVVSLDELERAAREGRLREVPGIGPKSEANILRAMERMREAGWDRLPLYVADRVARLAIDLVRTAPGVSAAEVAGSVRRRCETVADVDIVAAAVDAADVMRAVGAAWAARVDAAARSPDGSTAAVFRTKDGIDVDVRVVAPSDFATALHRATGSAAHCAALAAVARRRGLAIDERGLLCGEAGAIPIASEADVYEALGLQYVPPELREDAGEVEAAAEGRLPVLVEEADVRGDLHVHSDWSDGACSVEAMAEAAKARGHEYIAICDHSKSLRIARGLSDDDLARQIEHISELNRRPGRIAVLAGAEVDIRTDGSLDYGDDVLARLDIVIASVHSGFGQPRDAMTRRIVSAIRSGRVDIVGHPTGRVIGSRLSYDVDLDAVIEEAAKHGVALEINAYPERLDLDSHWARVAMERGAMLAIDTDSHSPAELEHMSYGVGVARRAWLGTSHVINCWSLKRLREWLAARRSA